MIYPVILCGGSGTRLWPSSRKAYPKQFAPLVGSESLYQTTLRRFLSKDFAAPLILTGDDFRFMATEQAAAMGLADARVVVEPVARDTAPAILTAALILADDPEALMLVAPSDHVIQDVPAFLAAVHTGTKAALAGSLVTFGITPERPETGYGYLELSEQAEAGVAVPLKSFREKPDQAQHRVRPGPSVHAYPLERRAPKPHPSPMRASSRGPPDVPIFPRGKTGYPP